MGIIGGMKGGISLREPSAIEQVLFMTDNEKRDIAVHARLCGARHGDVIVLDDGSRWKLAGLTIVPA